MNTHLFGAGDQRAADARRKRQAEAAAKREAAKNDHKTK